MLSKLFHAFRAQNPEPDLPDPDAELALGALLVRVAKSDRDYQLEEISLIDRILARAVAVPALEAVRLDDLMQDARAVDADHLGALIADRARYPAAGGRRRRRVQFEEEQQIAMEKGL